MTPYMILKTIDAVVFFAVRFFAVYFLINCSFYVKKEAFEGAIFFLLLGLFLACFTPRPLTEIFYK